MSSAAAEIPSNDLSAISGPLNSDARMMGPRACPLCDSVQAAISSSITPAQLIAAWKAMGVEISREALGDLAELKEIHLWQCTDCLFEFSHVEHAGGALFYEELQRQLPNYYPVVTPEYTRAVTFAKEQGIADILDVGCGAGAFLNHARKAGLQTHGVELNPKAAAIAQEAGHTIYNDLLHTLISRGNHPRFSLVTTWQVLEHVSDPVGFLRECTAFVRPGGYLAVAVPAEDGINSLAPFNPHVWPPHHVTRWRLKHLRQLGDKLGLKFVMGGNDPMDPYNARGMWDLHNLLAPVFGYQPYPGGRLFSKVLAAASGRTGFHKILPDWGHSTYGFFKKT